MEPDPLLIRQPNGMWRETRFTFSPGDHVVINAGTLVGQRGVIDSLAGQWRNNQGLHDEPGYNVRLGNDRWISIAWWMVDRFDNHQSRNPSETAATPTDIKGDYD